MVLTAHVMSAFCVSSMMPSVQQYWICCCMRLSCSVRCLYEVVCVKLCMSHCMMLRKYAVYPTKDGAEAMLCLMACSVLMA